MPFQNEARKLNHQEVVEEDKRNKLPANWEQKKRRVEWEEEEEQRRKVPSNFSSLCIAFVENECFILSQYYMETSTLSSWPRPKSLLVNYGISTLHFVLDLFYTDQIIEMFYLF